MSGFAFRYRLSGQRPTIELFELRAAQRINRGDMLSLDRGDLELARTGDSALVGAALETLDGDRPTTSIRAIVDADAVYGVGDAHIRLKGTSLDLSAASGAHGVEAGPNGDFVVDVDSGADDETLVTIDSASHYSPSLRALDERLVGGVLNAAIARSVVRYHAEQLGRGPTKAHAFHHDNIVVVVLEDTMTRSDQSLVAAGRGDAVLYTKRAVQETLGPYLRSSIERLTGCKVQAFMSANHLEPDLVAELFVLDRPVPGQSAPSAPGAATDR
jgi:uncharacterized protein YbcI